MSIIEFIRKNCDLKSDDPFYVFNVEDVIKKHKKWLEVLPRVTPYYAIKANRFPLLLDIMVKMGLRFECASQFEMNEILKRSAKPENIIYANPCKTNTSLEYSKEKKIDLMTFDNEEELAKIKALYQDAKLVLRIKVEDNHSNSPLNSKFGADMKNVQGLLEKAKEFKLNVVGVAFHVGSGCLSSQSYENAIKTSRKAFNLASYLGFQMSILDIGGGFPGTKNFYYVKKKDLSYISSFEDMAHQINKSLALYYPENDLTIIGEPGRYYCESAFTLITKIIGKTTQVLNDEKLFMYYINDGIYGSFITGIVDNIIYKPIPFTNNSSHLGSREEYQSILWGATLDSKDIIKINFKMLEMNIGEWIIFEDMGAYSLSFAEYGFNGMPSPTVKVISLENAENFQNNQ